jgi:hypothetical protein
VQKKKTTHIENVVPEIKEQMKLGDVAAKLGKGLFERVNVFII